MTTTEARLAAALADRYGVERELGAGGMATVFLAADILQRRRDGGQHLARNTNADRDSMEADKR